MIRIENIYKSFEQKEILKNVSTRFERGKCSLIIGASGSGKTVLLKSIIGLHEPDSGEIWFDDVLFNRSDEATKKSIRSQIGMLFQGSALFDFATAEQNVMFPLDFFTNMSREEKLDRANFCLQKVALENVNHKYPSELSGGMQKRVGIARAIALNPKYLFCDEPNSGLDPLTSIHIDRLIKDITEEYNMTTVINTHDMNSVLEIGDRIVFIYQGQKKWEGSRNDIFDTECDELNDFVFASNMARQLKNHQK